MKYQYKLPLNNLYKIVFNVNINYGGFKLLLYKQNRILISRNYPSTHLAHLCTMYDTICYIIREINLEPEELIPNRHKELMPFLETIKQDYQSW